LFLVSVVRDKTNQYLTTIKIYIFKTSIHRFAKILHSQDFSTYIAYIRTCVCTSKLRRAENFAYVYLHAGDLCAPAVRRLYMRAIVACVSRRVYEARGDRLVSPHAKATRCRSRAFLLASSVRARLRLATRSDLAFVMLSAH